MKILRFFVSLLIIVSCQGMHAQKKKGGKTAAKKKTEQVQPSAEDLLYENMLESTQRVFFIDSIVVDQNDFIRHIPLPKECGMLKTLNSEQETGYAFINEFGNKMYYSVEDTLGNSTLFTRDKLGEKWSNPIALSGISDNCSNYPFMMADGMTFYFAHKGENTLGGYDIFVTRYDGETGEFLRPNNIGLPFNSKANDYMYVVDELDSLGWLVTDRHQPEGKVCIYTFVPSKNRENFDLEVISNQDVRQYADIQSIEATWPSVEERETAIRRLEMMKNRRSPSLEKASFSFVINDRIIYSRFDDFHSSTARSLFEDLLQNKKRSENDAKQLEALRKRFHQADEAGRQQLRQTILVAEQELEQLNLSIKSLEKRIRNEELSSLTK
jgi:hypothetical protein